METSYRRAIEGIGETGARMNHNFQLHRKYLSIAAAANLVRVADKFFWDLYADTDRADFMKQRVIYPPDLTKERQAFACRVRIENSAKSRAIDIEKLPRPLKKLSLDVMELLDAKAGIFILNIQRYRSGRAKIPPHFDGEYLRWRHDADGQILMEHGLRPRECALLCLVNGAPDSATTLVANDGAKTPCHVGVGDLLIFDNQRQTHCVEAFNQNRGNESGIVRYMIGLRSITVRCNEVSYGHEKPVSPEYADYLISSNLSANWGDAPF